MATHYLGKLAYSVGEPCSPSRPIKATTREKDTKQKKVKLGSIEYVMALEKPFNFKNEIFETMFNQLSGGIFLKDIHSRYQFVSPSFVPLLGYKNHDQIVDMTDFDIKCDAVEFASQFIEEDQSVIKNKNFASFIYIMKYADGNIYYMLGNKRPFFEPQSSNVIGMLGQLTLVVDHTLIRAMNGLLSVDMKYFKNKKLPTGIYKICNDKNDDVRLSDKQAICLFYLLRGKTTKEIALLLGRSPRTIEVHIEKLKIKFNCPNKALLIAKAIELGYLYHIPKLPPFNELRANENAECDKIETAST